MLKIVYFKRLILALSIFLISIDTLMADSSLNKKIQERKTINTFAAWIDLYHDRPSIAEKNYNLIWNGSCPGWSNRKAISVFHVEWHSYDKNWGEGYPPLEFRTQRPFGRQEDGSRFWTDIDSNRLPQALVSMWKLKQDWEGCNGAHGVLFDFWRNDLSGGYSQEVIRKARQRIAKQFREEFGSDFIIMGNVNWKKDVDTINYLNGVYLELWKDSSRRLYTHSELTKLQSLLEYYNVNLQFPKIIAIDGWRKTQSMTLDDMNSTENRRMAKLLTAMSVVIPDNGYIMYGDNNSDDGSSDHFHLFYDFYNFDIGKPVGGRIEVRNGAGYKEHQEGFIAYNISNGKQTFTRSNGEKIEIEAKSGLFCRNAGALSDCLSYD